MVFYLHFNRNAVKAGDPKVWSVRTSKGCYHTERVVLEVPVVTVFKPHLKTNPKYFLTGRGVPYVYDGQITTFEEGTTCNG